MGKPNPQVGLQMVCRDLHRAPSHLLPDRKYSRMGIRISAYHSYLCPPVDVL